MQEETNGILDKIAALSSMNLVQHMNETKFSRKFPTPSRRNPGTTYTRTMQMEFVKASDGSGGGIHYRWGGGYVETAQLKVAYCWSTRRNKAGYFLGWRQVERKSKPGHVVRDQLIARKGKKRLKERQIKLTAALKAKNSP